MADCVVEAAVSPGSDATIRVFCCDCGRPVFDFLGEPATMEELTQVIWEHQAKHDNAVA